MGVDVALVSTKTGTGWTRDDHVLEGGACVPPLWWTLFGPDSVAIRTIEGSICRPGEYIACVTSREAALALAAQRKARALEVLGSRAIRLYDAFISFVGDQPGRFAIDTSDVEGTAGRELALEYVTAAVRGFDTCDPADLQAIFDGNVVLDFDAAARELRYVTDEMVMNAAGMFVPSPTGPRPESVARALCGWAASRAAPPWQTAAGAGALFV